MDTHSPTRLVLGCVAGIYGVHGWIKVVSYTRPRENILDYGQWWLGQHGEWHLYERIDGRPQGKGLVAALAGVTDRDTARGLIGADIAVDRSQLPPVEPGEYYWCDLIGLRVLFPDGAELGRVAGLEETGANDVLVVQGPARQQWLIPFVRDHYVLDVDLDAGVMTVAWTPED